MAMRYQCMFYGKLTPRRPSLEIRRHYAKLVGEMRHNAANATGIQKEYAAVRKRVYGQVNKIVAVHCTDILERKTGKGQRVYFLQKKKKSSRSQALSSRLSGRLVRARLCFPFRSHHCNAAAVFSLLCERDSVMQISRLLPIWQLKLPLGRGNKTWGLWAALVKS